MVLESKTCRGNVSACFSRALLLKQSGWDVASLAAVPKLGVDVPRKLQCPGQVPVPVVLPSVFATEPWQAPGLPLPGLCSSSPRILADHSGSFLAPIRGSLNVWREEAGEVARLRGVAAHLGAVAARHRSGRGSLRMRLSVPTALTPHRQRSTGALCSSGTQQRDRA